MVLLTYNFSLLYHRALLIHAHLMSFPFPRMCIMVFLWKVADTGMYFNDFQFGIFEENVSSRHGDCWYWAAIIDRLNRSRVLEYVLLSRIFDSLQRKH